MKSVRIRSYSGPYFPAFGLNTERYSVPLCIQSECEKIRARTTPNMDTFYAVIPVERVHISSIFLAPIFETSLETGYLTNILQI